MGKEYLPFQERNSKIIDGTKERQLQTGLTKLFRNRPYRIWLFFSCPTEWPERKQTKTKIIFAREPYIDNTIRALRHFWLFTLSIEASVLTSNTATRSSIASTCTTNTSNNYTVPEQSEQINNMNHIVSQLFSGNSQGYSLMSYGNGKKIWMYLYLVFMWQSINKILIINYLSNCPLNLSLDFFMA